MRRLEWQTRQELNLQPRVLETRALPIELHACILQLHLIPRQHQTPPDLVVKFQRTDIVAVILRLVWRLRVVYQREIKGVSGPYHMRRPVYH